MHSAKTLGLLRQSLRMTRQTIVAGSQAMQISQKLSSQASFASPKSLQSAGLVQNMPSRSFSSLPDHIALEMPNLSPTMEKGNIGVWYKKIGDKIVPGDVLCSIETDKATVDFEMQDEGFVAATLFSDGTKDIPLGTPLAIIVDDESEIAAFKDYKPEGTTSEAPAEVQATSAPTIVAAATPSPVSHQAAPTSKPGDR